MTTNLSKWIIGILAISILVFSTYFSMVFVSAKISGEIPQFFSPPRNQLDSTTLIFVILSIILGIICGHLYEQARSSKRKKINLLNELKKMLSAKNFFMSMIIAPLIFNSIYILISDNPQGIRDYLLAFQNGFFWESVISGVLISRD